MGKPHDDIASREISLPVIYALRQGSVAESLARLYRQEHLDAQDVAQAVAILERAGSCPYVQGLAASAQLGTVMAGAEHEAEHYRQFGWNLGLAFQVVDDILGIWGDPVVTGKPAADDLLNRKMTLPVIFALRQGAEGQELAAIYRQERWSDQDVSRVLATLERVGARDYAQNLAAHHEAAAMAALQAAARPPAAEHLRALAASLTGRQR